MADLRRGRSADAFRRPASAIVLTAHLVFFGAGIALAQDPLPSWNDGATKRGIVAFVAETTTPGTNFVPPGERIAVFDNDGTLWTEQPVYVQAAFTADRLKAMALEHPELLRKEAVQEFLRNGVNGDAPFEPAGGLAEVLAAAHAGLTPEQYERAVMDWLETASDPRFDRPYTDLVFQPMVELIAFLQVHGYQTYIVSGGETAFMRPWVESAYGIPRTQVVGSTVELTYELVHDSIPVLVRKPRVDFVDDHEGKPVGIENRIGLRPVAAFGNSDGDKQMLEYTAGGPGARFMLLVHHDDCQREYCYDRQSKVGKLDEALDEANVRGWTVVSMKDDWKYIYPFELPGGAHRH